MNKKEVIVPANDLVCLGKDKLQELIRCKDCKYWSTETEQTSMPNMRRCTWWRNIGTFPIDFCSRAERKENR